MLKIDEPVRNNNSSVDDHLKRKRKMTEDRSIINGKRQMNETTPKKVFFFDEDDENDMTRLTLSISPPPPPPPPLYLMPELSLLDIPQLSSWTYTYHKNYQFQLPSSAAVVGGTGGSSSSPFVYHNRQGLTRSRRVGGCRGAKPRVVLRPWKQELIPAMYPWVTTRRATVHSFDYLVAREIYDICGTVKCRRCEEQYEMRYDVRVEFPKIWKYVAENKGNMGDCAPEVWRNPVLPTCQFCDHENSARPIIAEKKRGINWLFLLLGRLLGCCTLDQLKYFCKHSRNHRTGSKDRVLYLTLLGLCLQLDPNGPFDPLDR